MLVYGPVWARKKCPFEYSGRATGQVSYEKCAGFEATWSAPRFLVHLK